MKGCHDPPPVNTLICFKIKENKEGIPYGHNPESQKNIRMDFFFPGSLFLLDKFVEENWVEMMIILLRIEMLNYYNVHLELT